LDAGSNKNIKDIEILLKINWNFPRHGQLAIKTVLICFGKFQFLFNNISISSIFLFDPASSESQNMDN
jgi:hypothetical protein